MNNEMIKFLLFLLNSEDLKKQSNRIIAEVGHNGNAQLLEDILTAIQQLIKLNNTSLPVFEKSISDKLKLLSTTSDLRIELKPIFELMNPQKEMLTKLFESSQPNTNDLQTIMKKQDEILTRISNLEAGVNSVENLERYNKMVELLTNIKGNIVITQPTKVK